MILTSQLKAFRASVFPGGNVCRIVARPFVNVVRLYEFRFAGCFVYLGKKVLAYKDVFLSL